MGIKEEIALKEEKLRRESRKSLLRFTLQTMPTFRPAQFHRQYYQILTDFAFGRIKKLMVFMPPQHGKSEGSTRRLPAFLLGINPDLKIAIVSYSAPKARKFNREVQRIIDSEEYAEVFPDTYLNGKNVSSASTSWLRNADECEIVDHRGGFKTVGVGGALTGEPVDVLIMDDLYKDAKSAWSPTIRENVSDWYDTVAETRLHNDSRQLIVFTRWHEDDLAGKLLREQGNVDEGSANGWKVCIFPAIKLGAPTYYDNREEGEALWPERHSLEKLQDIRERNPQVFESLYQQDPKPLEGLMYDRGFREYEVIPPSEKNRMLAYIDTADKGSDYLCCVIFRACDTANYVVSVYYTQKPMSVTQTETANILTKYEVEEVLIEGNNGGQGFADNVERYMRLLGNTKTIVRTFTQTANKEVRIFSRSADVMNLTYMPRRWDVLFPEFYRAISIHQKEGKNEHDDAADALTGTVEWTWGGIYLGDSYEGGVVGL